MKEGGVDRMWWLAGRQLPQSSIFRAWLQTQGAREKERGSEREEGGGWPKGWKIDRARWRSGSCNWVASTSSLMRLSG